jgi:hypothetical protein
LTGVRGVSGSITALEGVGSTPHLDDVMLAPSSKHQLVSVGSLTDETGASVVFTGVAAFLVNDKTGSQCDLRTACTG